MRRSADDDETVRKRSSWLLPIGIFAVTCILSALVLLYYLAPTSSNLFEEQVAQTSRSDIVVLRVGAMVFHIPANYLLYSSTRQGGDHREVEMAALLPHLSGWSNWAADSFADNNPDSEVVYLSLHTDRVGLTEAQKLARVYPDYLIDKAGRAGPYGLRQYSFRADSNYRNEDLFVGQTDNGPVILRCVQMSPQTPSPNCLRESVLAKGVALSYRFKRSHLKDWQEIAEKTRALITSFRVPVKK